MNLKTTVYNLLTTGNNGFPPTNSLAKIALATLE